MLKVPNLRFGSVHSNKKSKFSLRAKITFQLGVSDYEILKKIKDQLGVGQIHEDKSPTRLVKATLPSFTYRVTAIKEISVLLEYLEKFPLLTVKSMDLHNFKEAFLIIKSKEHLTLEGLSKLKTLSVLPSKHILNLSSS